MCLFFLEPKILNLKLWRKSTDQSETVHLSQELKTIHPIAKAMGFLGSFVKDKAGYLHGPFPDKAHRALGSERVRGAWMRALKAAINALSSTFAGSLA
jgi:hypothetical protein